MGDKEAAKAAKHQGNKEFKADNFEAAIECYDKAIKLDPEEVQYPANRAMVHLKMEKWEEAEKDCDAALVIDPEFGKVSIRILYEVGNIFIVPRLWTGGVRPE